MLTHIHTENLNEPPNFAAMSYSLAGLLMLAAICYAAPARAVLGGDAASVETDRLHMKVAQAASQLPSASGSYTVHETILPTGTRVRQYVSKAGTVFAVTWSGPFMPDLRQLMGTHFDTMIARQAQNRHAGQRVYSQHDPDLVIESGGRPRHFVGRAYLPGALPAGVTGQDIKQ
ncbi:hypothetical protein GALL_29760 [mine drainage metagenome]|uniref:DUF2844 domain-containing protein n=1 Tax=mine drainage metagenome TaxID=410659 RepID=A0A1J5TJA5_9ZZZZ